MNRRLERGAIDCSWLRRTIDPGNHQSPVLTLCRHIVREGQDCVGPFLENMETECRLWEPNERLMARLRSVREGGADDRLAAGEASR